MRTDLFKIAFILTLGMLFLVPAASHAQNLNGSRSMDAGDNGSIGSNPFFGEGSEGEPEVPDSVDVR